MLKHKLAKDLKLQLLTAQTMERRGFIQVVRMVRIMQRCDGKMVIDNEDRVMDSVF